MTTGFVGGGCLCGAVRFRIALPPRWVAHCHCSMCRPGEVHVTLANLDSADGLAPQAHAYWSSRAGWAMAAPDDSLAKVEPPDHGE